MKVQARQIEGLRELIAEVLAEEGRALLPRDLLADVEEIKRSPVGAVIRMESDIEHLKEGQEALQKGQETLRTEMKEGLETLRAEMKEGLETLRAEMKEGQETLRTEFRGGLANLEKVSEARFKAVEARFQGLENRFDQFEKRLARSNFWVRFFAGLLAALFAAQLVLTFIR